MNSIPHSQAGESPPNILTKNEQGDHTKENPWMQMAGKYKDDPQFDAMLEAIAEYRLEVDAQIPE
jgi:hypothetical protein